MRKWIILLGCFVLGACSKDEVENGPSFGISTWQQVTLNEEKEGMIRFGDADHVYCDTPRLAIYLHGPLDSLRRLDYDGGANSLRKEVIDSLLEREDLKEVVEIGDVEEASHGYEIKYRWTPSPDIVEPGKYYAWLIKTEYVHYGVRLNWGFTFLVKPDEEMAAQEEFNENE